MVNHPPSIGTGPNVFDRPTHRDWLSKGARDLEVLDFLILEVPLGALCGRFAPARTYLDECEVRVGFKGPFNDLPLHIKDSEIAPLLSHRM